MKRLTSIAILLALPATAMASELRSIPARFHGHWAMSVAQCTSDPRDDANIRIGARFIHDYATRMAVRSVSVLGTDRLIVGGRVDTGTDRHDSATRLELFEKGTALGVGEGEDYGRYVRCAR